MKGIFHVILNLLWFLGTAGFGTGREINVRYNALGWIEELEEANHLTRYAYDAGGNTRKKAFSNGQAEVCTYDDLNRLRTRTATAGANALQSFIYDYDEVGNVKRMQESSAPGVPDRIVDLDYDRVYRLKKESITSGAQVQLTEYKYDAAHNRQEKTVSGAPEGNGRTLSKFNALNQLTDFTSTSGITASFTYDANGNRRTRQSSDGRTTTYAYDPDNRLTLVDDNGRIEKTRIQPRSASDVLKFK